MSLENARIPKELLQDVINNIEYNKVIVEYYKRFALEPKIALNSDTLKKNTEKLHFCNRFWTLDKYQLQKIKDFKKTNLCHDKFCANCKKIKQASRMSKYIPELEQYKGNLYHLTLTLPNCDGVDLRLTISRMAVAFRKLIGYISSREKIKGIDFSSWGYQGAVRSLEVPFKGNQYHMHYHVGFVFESFPEMKKKEENKYSWDYRSGLAELKRLFSEQEILIQKIWYLLLNNMKVTKVNIEELEIGYSCTFDKFKDDDYAELFKYITKERDNLGNILTYENFVGLYYGLYRVKQIQGYGCLYQITDDGDLEEQERIYEELIQEIRKKESPVAVVEKPQELILDSEYMLISRKSYFKYLKKL